MARDPKGSGPAPHWQFPERFPDQVRQDPVEAEFFAPKGLAKTAIRESIQNSLDARQGPDRPVKVRFSIHEGKRVLPASKWGPYLEGLKAHLKACGEQPAPPFVPSDEPMDFLVIEDFGTKGLLGDPEQDDDNESQDQNFFAFWRAVGYSPKKQGQKGSWGLGKTAFFAASRINACFGLTVRAGDRRRLLMGRCDLKSHRVSGRKCMPQGFFAGFKPNGFQLPLEDEETLARFCKDFGLTRGVEPGLSLVIPFLRKEEFNARAIAKEVIGQVLLPVIKGDLEVDVEDAHETIRIRSDITESVADLFKDEPDKVASLNSLATFLLEAETLPPPRQFTLQGFAEGERPLWSPALFTGIDLDAAKQLFQQGKAVVFTIPLALRRKRSASPAVTDHFKVCLQHDVSLQHPDELYLRDGLAISDIRRLRNRQPVRGLVRVEGGALAALMRDSENPSHTEWQPRGPKMADWEYGSSIVSFVQESLNQIAMVLGQATKQTDWQLLADLFPDPVKATGGSGRAKPKKEIKIPAPRPKPCRQPQQVAGGFVLADNPDYTGDKNRLEVKVAYDTEGRNPFPTYDPLDFRLQDSSEFQIDSEGVEIQEREDNRLAIRISSRPWKLSVKGFDARRDLVIHVST